MYAGVALVAALGCFIALIVSDYPGSGTRSDFRAAFFNVTAIISTTGFSTADFAAWPVVAQVVLFGLMFMGAMGGSTGGGLKVVRVR